MKKILKKGEVLEAFTILYAANYKQLDDADKIKLWKIARVMKPVAKQLEDDSRDAAEKLKPENFDAQLEKAKEFEAKVQKGDTDKLPMTEDEHLTFIREVFQPFNNLVQKAVDDETKKEVEIDFEPLTEDAFGKLMASNDWKIQEVMVLGNLIVG